MIAVSIPGFPWPILAGFAAGQQKNKSSLPLARGARRTRATLSFASLPCQKGVAPPPVLDFPQVQGLCPLEIPPPSARGGRAHDPLGRGCGTWAGALREAVAPGRGLPSVTAGPGRGRPDPHSGGAVRGRGWTPAPRILKRMAHTPVWSGWTPRPWGAHTGRG